MTNKTLKIFAFATLIAIVQLFGQAPTTGLVGYWNFDSNLNDASGSNNTAIANGGNFQIDRHGNFQSAYEFTDKYDYLSLTNQAGPYAQWTISFWAYVVNGGGNIIVTRGGNGNYLSLWPEFRENANGNRHSWNGHQNSVPVDPSSSVGNWKFYVFHSDGTNIHLRINGDYKGYRTPVNPEIAVNRIGSDRNDHYFTLKGLIDDLRIYSQQLTTSEIEALENSTLFATSYPELYAKDGKIGIGTTPGDTEDDELIVKGGIKAVEITVEDITNFPDFVFEEAYELMSLEQTEKFILENGHLPEIPPAPTVEKEGLKLKEMNLLLLQKIEEMTLHQIQLNKELIELKEQIEQLKTSNP